MNPLRSLRGDQNKFVRIWLAIALILLLIAGTASYFAVSEHHNAQQAQTAAAKSDRALTDETAIVHQLTVVAAQAKAAADTANRAVSQVASAVSCINTLLGARGPLTNADTNAEVDIFTRLLAVLVADPKQQAALYKTFLAETRKDVAVLQKDKKFRTQHPLGLC